MKKKRRYTPFSYELCVQAVMDCFDKKWRRRDVTDVAEKYAGISRKAIVAEVEAGAMHLRCEAADAVGAELFERVTAYLETGDIEVLDLGAVTIRPRADGVTGKMREIASLTIFHQLVGHLLYLGLQPLFKARLKPYQFASIPGRGQTALKRKAEKLMRSKKRKINYTKKTDVRHAYATTKYADVLDRLTRELPDGCWVISLMQAAARKAPDGHLIIGGYIDAWLFNLMMSYALDYIGTLYKTRRGKRIYCVSATLAYMDDFGLMGASKRDLRKAARKLSVWLKANFDMELKIQRGETRILSLAEERKRRKKTGAKRSAPGLDMGGFVVHRGYTSIRGTIFLRLRRQFLRAKREKRRYGNIAPKRARKLISYNGYFRRTNTEKAAKEYGIYRLCSAAKRTVSSMARENNILALKGA